MFEGETALRLVAIDLETTGLEEDAEIIEVGAVAFDLDGRIHDRFESLVRANRPVPPWIEQMTGIRSEDLRAAPALAEVLPILRAFVGEGPFVAHNVPFDLGHLRRAGWRYTGDTLDTAYLARLLLPELRSFSLRSVAEALGVEPAGEHRALADAETCANVCVRLLHRARALDEDTRLALSRSLALHQPLLASLLGGDRAFEGTAAPIVPLRAYEPWPKLQPTRAPLSFETRLARAFEALACGLDGYEERSEQREMAGIVARALSYGGYYLVEAGTGVGKSLAYLLPAALWALEHGRRVIVSTHTLALQDQLLTREIPTVRRVLREAGVVDDESDLRVAVVKGRSNYLCVRRWTAHYAALLADPEVARLASAILLWLPKTETGDRAELKLDRGDVLTWVRLSAEGADCLSSNHSFVQERRCFLLRARERAERAHIVIVNHALLLADAAHGGNAVPPADALIIDEAHALEEAATQQFAVELSARRLQELLDPLHRPPGREGSGGGFASLFANSDSAIVRDLAGALAVSASAVRSGSAAFFAALRLLWPADFDDDKLPLDRSLRASAEWAEVEARWAELDAALERTLALATELELALEPAEEGDELPDVLAGELAVAAGRLRSFRASLAAVIGGSEGEMVEWAERESDGGVALRAVPLDVSPILREHCFDRYEAVVATSATLFPRAGDEAFVLRRFGLDEAEIARFGSPFDYRRSALLATVADLPDPNDAEFSEGVGRALIELVTASRGRALVLFTSHRALQVAARAIREPLAERGLAVRAQGIDGSPRQLLSELRTVPGTVVLGTASFWEGVDVPGDALSLLVIVRLPFSVPTDPVFRARASRFERPFEEFALPAAILRFRQGFGRLIRRRDDRGAVVVLDGRIRTRRYGAAFLDALPECARFDGSLEEVIAAVREWLEGAVP